jgi:hypothetical protein
MTNYPMSREQVTLLTAARTAWRRRGVAKARGLAFSEESLTETVLMDIAESYPGQLRIVSFNKHQEGRNGADWAWAFRNAAGTQNLAMLVQAKALDFTDRTYPEIKRKVGRGTPPVRQIDRLLDTANSWGWPAVYVFYNHLSKTSRIPNNCQTLPKMRTSMPEAWGISIATAEAVSRVLDDQSFDTHRRHSMPLHCLLCSGGSGWSGREGSPALALSSLRRLAGQSDDRIRTPNAGESASPEWRLTTALPELFTLALEASSEARPDRLDEGLRSLAEAHPNLAGVAVLQDAGPKRS